MKVLCKKVPKKGDDMVILGYSERYDNFTYQQARRNVSRYDWVKVVKVVKYPTGGATVTFSPTISHGSTWHWDRSARTIKEVP